MKIARVRAPIVPAAWTLELEDWKPADPSNPKDLRTAKEVHQRDLATLQSWSKVAGLEDVSGIGRYRTTIDLGADWTGDDGAYLELGEVNDTFRVRVNGELLPPCDPMDGVVDLGHVLVPGVEPDRGGGRLHPDQPAAHRHPRRLRGGRPPELRPRRARPAGAVRREGGAVLIAVPLPVEGCRP